MKQKEMTAKRFRQIFIRNALIAIVALIWAIIMVVQYIGLHTGQIIVKWEVGNQFKDAIINIWGNWIAYCPLTIFVPIILIWRSWRNISTATRKRRRNLK